MRKLAFGLAASLLAIGAPSGAGATAYTVSAPISITASNNGGTGVLGTILPAYHQGAKALSVRVLDSEEAATYDRHADGGALAKRHLVASVSRSEGLGLDSIEVRGAPIEP